MKVRLNEDKEVVKTIQEGLKAKATSGLLVDIFDDDDEIPCANCFI